MSMFHTIMQYIHTLQLYSNINLKPPMRVDETHSFIRYLVKKLNNSHIFFWN